MKPSFPYSANRPPPRELEDGCFAVFLENGIYTVVDADDVRDIARNAWRIHNRPQGGKFYAVRSISHRSDGRRRVTEEAMHRRLADARPGQMVDHRDGDSLNNRRSNLRVCTPLQNSQNRKKSALSSQPYKGVYASGNRWCSRIKVSKRDLHLGTYDHPEQAAAAYDAAAKLHYGDFAAVNFPHHASVQDDRPVPRPADNLSIVSAYRALSHPSVLPGASVSPSGDDQSTRGDFQGVGKSSRELGKALQGASNLNA